MFSHFYLFVFHNTNNLFKILQIFIMLTEKLKQSTVYGSILTLETVQDTAGKTDRVKIQIQFLGLTLLFQSLSFCRTPELRKIFFIEASPQTPFTVILIIIEASPFQFNFVLRM